MLEKKLKELKEKQARQVALYQQMQAELQNLGNELMRNDGAIKEIEKMISEGNAVAPSDASKEPGK